MRPILLQWRGFTIWSYPALLYLGLIAGVVAGNAAAHVAGIDALRTYVAMMLLIPMALIGSRLLYVAAQWRLYRRDLRRAWNRRDGGAAMYGGLAFSLALSMPLLGALDLSLGAFWDVTTFTILVGMIFTRVGCLLNGCCAGRPTKRWGILLPNHRGVWERRIPTQCLEAVWAGVLLVCALAVWRRLPFPGALFLLATTGYAVGRLPLESAREPEPGAGRFTMYHAISVMLIVLSLAGLAVYWPK